MFFYLKVNRNCNYAIKNIQHWIDTIEANSKNNYVFVCDNINLRERIETSVVSTKPLHFIESDKNDKVKKIVKAVCVEKWENAGYAHMTTFKHSAENRIERFWNVDADDTFLCLPPRRCAELLNKVAQFADENTIDLFSLDMWHTVVRNVYNELHWTFGITYSTNRVDWLSVATRHCMDQEIEKLKLIPNIDKYFTYLSLLKDEVKIKTFYIEKLKFIHYSDDFFGKFEGSGFYYWKNKKLCLPLIYYCIGAKKRGKLKIPKEIVRIRFNTTEHEQMLYLNDYASDKLDLLKER